MKKLVLFLIMLLVLNACAGEVETQSQSQSPIKASDYIQIDIDCSVDTVQSLTPGEFSFVVTCKLPN